MTIMKIKFEKKFGETEFHRIKYNSIEDRCMLLPILEVNDLFSTFKFLLQKVKALRQDQNQI
jgi:hypothetical protein